MTDISLPLLGPLAWIDVILLVWFFLTALSVVYVAWDAYANNPDFSRCWRWRRASSFQPRTPILASARAMWAGPSCRLA